jgi:hypothetical protein
MNESNACCVLLDQIDISRFLGKVDLLEGKRCISCGKFVNKKYWHLPKDDVYGCGLRPLCEQCK